MKWVVGLDLRPRSAGAMHFARWLASQGTGASFIGVHVLGQDHMLAVLKDHHLDEVLSGARRACEEAVRAEGASAEISTIDVVQAVTVPEGLCDHASRLAADGILLGRAARRDEQRLVRLGRVARRLLRITTHPVVVVPPDLREQDFTGNGPVVALTKLDDHSVEVCRFAAKMAEQLGRPLAVVHVLEAANVAAAHYIAAATLSRIDAERRSQAEEALGRWVAEHGIAPATAEILTGGVVEEAITLAEQRRAVLIVAGSRHGGTKLQRLLVAATGSALAAAATLPVAVVPPPHAPPHE